MSFAQETQLFVSVEAEKPPVRICREKQPSVRVACPPMRSGPITLGKLDCSAVDLPRRKIEPPELRVLILSEHAVIAHSKETMRGNFRNHGRLDRLEIQHEQMMRAYAYNSFSGRHVDSVQHGFSGNALAEICENRRFKASFLNEVLAEVDFWYLDSVPVA